MIKEPYIRIRTSDETGKLTTASDDLVIAMVVHSATGPTDDTLVNSVSDLLANYSFSSSVTKNDHITFIHAAKMLQFTPLRIVRACSSKVKAGRTDTGKIVYADEVYNPFEYGQQVVLSNDSDITIGFKNGNAEVSASTVEGLISKYGELNRVSSSPYYYTSGTGNSTITHIEGSANITPLSGTNIVENNNSGVLVNSSSLGSNWDISSDSIQINGYEFSIGKSEGSVSLWNSSINSLKNNFDIGGIITLLSDRDVVMGTDFIADWNILRSTITAPDGWNVALLKAENNELKNSDVSGQFDTSDITTIKTYPVTDPIKVSSFGMAFYQLGTPSDGTLPVNKTIVGFNYSTGNIDLISKLNSDNRHYTSTNIDATGAAGNGLYSINTSEISVTKYELSVDESNIVEVILNDVTYTGNAPSTSGSFIELTSSEGSTISAQITYDGDLDDGAENFTAYLVSQKVIIDGVQHIVYLNGFALQGDTSSDETKITKSYSSIPILSTSDLESSTKTLESVFSLIQGSNFAISSTVDKIFWYIAGSNQFNSSTISSPANYTIDSNGFYIQGRYAVGASCTNTSISIIGNTEWTDYVISGTTIDDVEFNDIYFNVQQQIKDSEGNWVNTVDSRTFYIGNYASSNPNEELIRLTTSSLVFGDWKHQLIGQLKNYYNIVEKSDGFCILGDGSTKWIFKVGKYRDESWNDISYQNYEDDYSQVLSSDHFIVFARNPSTKSQSSFELTQSEDDKEVFNLELTNGLNAKSYDISFVEDKVDGYGRQLYYTRVNDLSTIFYMVSLNGGLSTDVSKVSKVTFGNEIYVGEPTSQDFINALDKFTWSEKGIYYNFLMDGGYANTSYAKALVEKAKELYSEAFISIPQVITDKAQIIEYRKATNIDSWHGFASFQWQRDTTVGSFIANINRNTYLVERIVSNKAGGKEFAPPMHKINGVVSGSSTLYFNSKEDREELLSNQVNVVSKNLRNNTDFYRDALTMQTLQSDLSELNNAMMVNAGAHQLDTVLDNFIGQFNTVETRSAVTTAATRAVQTRLFKNQQFHPNEIKVVCDTTNNDADSIDANELWADLYYKFEKIIKYVEVWQRVVRLSKDLSEVGE